MLPVFNHPLKLAGEIGMLDAISGGRLEVGFARAFLPHEFARFGRSSTRAARASTRASSRCAGCSRRSTSRSQGRFHSFENVTSLPRPTQKPRPPFWVAALGTPESFVEAGRAGHGVMAIPLAGGQMKELLAAYREGWRSAGHPGSGRVMLAFHMFCARPTPRRPPSRAGRSTATCARWSTPRRLDAGHRLQGLSRLRQDHRGAARRDFESQVEKRAAWVGSPEAIADQIAAYDEIIGGFEIASLQVNFNDVAARTPSVRCGCSPKR